MIRELIILLIMASSCTIYSQDVYCRFELNSKIHYGKVEGNIIKTLDKAPWNGGTVKEGNIDIDIDEVKLLHPSQPQIILGLGGAYSDSWKVSKPYKSVRWFLKPPTSAASPNDTIFIPPVVDVLKVEVELVIIIGKTIKNASEEEAISAIFGYTLGNDVVASTSSYHIKAGEPQDQNETLLGPGLKIGDSFAPFGPFIYTNIEWNNRETAVLIKNSDGKIKIKSHHNTSKLLYSPAKIISDLSKILTLSPGDIVMTGTNKSYEVQSGDTVSVSIEGLGTLNNFIK